jgi:carbamoyltransferase
MGDYYVLGMTLGHNATAAITKNGEVIASASEERFVRIKNVYGYPQRAIAYCLQEAELTPQELDLVVLSSHITPPLKQTEGGLREESRNDQDAVSWFTLLSKVRGKVSKFKTLDMLGYQNIAPLFAKLTHKKRKEVLGSLLGVPEEKIVSSEHHLTHAYAGIFASDFFRDKDEKLLVVTVDGEGDMVSSSIGVFHTQDYRYERIASSSYAESLGHFYSAITAHLGMKILEHEYKVMGLAPYSDSDMVDKLMRKIRPYIWVDDELCIRTKVHSHRFEDVFSELFKGVRFDHVAAAAQKIVEEVLVTLVKKSIQKTGVHSVILSGGVFMNVKANYEILKLPEVKRLFAMPSCGDESLPLGSCYYGTLLHNKQALRSLQPLQQLYFGPAYSHATMLKALKKSEFDYKDYKHRVHTEVARLLSRGDVVARCDGRMEFGARALGNRSILADASRGDVVEEINKMIKMRDFWMPFAPSIMEEYALKYLKNPELLKKTKPYFMMVTFESTPLAQKHLKAALHPYDKTLRPQLVNKNINPRYYALLHSFMKKTKQYGLLNTSFNIHGEPIVCTPEDALHTLRESGLHYLALGDFIVRK